MGHEALPRELTYLSWLTLDFQHLEEYLAQMLNMFIE